MFINVIFVIILFHSFLSLENIMKLENCSLLSPFSNHYRYTSILLSTVIFLFISSLQPYLVDERLVPCPQSRCQCPGWSPGKWAGRGCSPLPPPLTRGQSFGIRRDQLMKARVPPPGTQLTDRGQDQLTGLARTRGTSHRSSPAETSRFSLRTSF
jgi:hypothetical protein